MRRHPRMTPHVDPLQEDQVPIAVIALWMVTIDPLIGMHEILVHLGVMTVRLLPIVGRILTRIAHIGVGSCQSLASTSALSREFVVDAGSTPLVVFHIPLVLMINISRGELTIRHLVLVIPRLPSLTVRGALALRLTTRLQREWIHVMLDGLTHRLGMWIVTHLLVVVQVLHLNDVIRVGITPPLVTTLVLDQSLVTREGRHHLVIGHRVTHLIIAMTDGRLLVHIGLQGTPLNDAMCGGITPRLVTWHVVRHLLGTIGGVQLRLPRSTAGVILHGIIVLNPGMTVVGDLTTVEPVNGSLVVLPLVRMKL